MRERGREQGSKGAREGGTETSKEVPRRGHWPVYSIQRTQHTTRPLTLRL